MLTKEYILLEPFAKEAWKKVTFKEVKKLSCNNSDNYVHTTLKRFVASDILQQHKIGSNLVYSLIITGGKAYYSTVLEAIEH